MSTTKPRVFIGSSVESLGLAHTLQQCLERAAEPTVWDQGTFEPSRFALESLINALDRYDFAAFFFSPDDVTKIRGAQFKTARDNVVFEMGLFVGRLGRERCFVVAPRGVENLRLPSDLLGLSPITYDTTRSDGIGRAALGPVATELENTMRAREHVTRPAPTATDDLVMNGDDVRACLYSFLDHRSHEANLHLMRFTEIEAQLELPRGSVAEHIEPVAIELGYRVKYKGAVNVLLVQAQDDIPF